MTAHLKIALLSLFALITVTCDGATYFSRAGGSWNDPSVWSSSPGGASCNCVPQGSDDIIIDHTITLQKHLTNGGGCLGGISGNFYITANGTLNGASTYDINVLSNGNLTVCGNLTCMNIEFFNGSVFRFCQGSQVRINGNFINRNNSPNIQVDGQVQIQGGFENGVGAYIAGNGSFIVVNGPAINQGTVFTCIGLYPCSLYSCLISSVCGMQVFLPVEWLSFSATSSEEGCLLEWATASETNVERFDVERSMDGINFESIGRTSAKGTTSELQRYSFMDRQVPSGLAYYRIRETDFDGKSSFSVSAAVRTSRRGGLSVYPNPVRGRRVHLRLDQETGPIRVELFDALGRCIFSSVTTAEPSGSDVEFPDHIGPGSYLLSVCINERVTFEHLLLEP
jgi:hypothetical protein